MTEILPPRIMRKITELSARDGLQQRLDVRERLIRGADQHVADQKAGPVGRTAPLRRRRS